MWTSCSEYIQLYSFHVGTHWFQSSSADLKCPAALISELKQDVVREKPSVAAFPSFQAWWFCSTSGFSGCLKDPRWSLFNSVRACFPIHYCSKGIGNCSVPAKKSIFICCFKKFSILISNYLIGGNITTFIFLILYNITIQLLLYNTSSVNANKLLIITCKTNSKPHCI